jgi:hypothetical protein
VPLQPAGREAAVPAARQRQQDVLAGDLGVGERERLQVGVLQHEQGGGWQRDPSVVRLVGVAHAGDERVPQRRRGDAERRQHRPGRPGTVGMQQRQHQVVVADPMVVQRLGLLGGEVDHLPDLPGPLADRWDLQAGMPGAAVGMGGRPRLDGRARPAAAAAGGRLGRREPDRRAGQLDDPAAGDAEDAGGFRRRDEVGVAGRGHATLLEALAPIVPSVPAQASRRVSTSAAEVTKATR